MNIKRMLLGLLGLQYSVQSEGLESARELKGVALPPPYTKMPSTQITSVVNMVNTARSKVKVRAYAMPHVSWDYSLEASLKQAVIHTNKSWWFGGDYAPAVRYNSQMLMKQPPFNTAFPGYDFMLHDGCSSTTNAVSKIFWMRAINQAKFFKYSSCSDDVNFQPNWGYINSYFSCADIDRNKTKLVSNVPWAWMWQYYPKIVNDDMDKFACMLLGNNGPNADGKPHTNHFFCYWGNKSHPQTSQKPYVAIEPGQKPGAGCPGRVVKNLCV